MIVSSPATIRPLCVIWLYELVANLRTWREKISKTLYTINTKHESFSSNKTIGKIQKNVRLKL